MLHFANAKGLIDEVSGVAPQPGPGLNIGLSLRYSWRLVLACVGAGVIAAAGVVAMSKPSFVANARVLFDPGGVDAGRHGAPRDLQQYAIDSAQLESQVQLLKSEQISRPVIDAHDLGNDPEFASAGPSLRARLLAMLGLGGARSSDGYGVVSNAFDSHLDVRRLGQSYVLQIAFQSADPAKAARLANAVTAAYIGRQVAGRIENAQRTSRFERPIRELEADGAVAAKAVKTGVIDTIAFPVADARVISAGLIPSGPSTPRTGLIMALGALLGLLAGGSWAMVRYARRRPIFSRQQIESELGLTCLGHLRRFSAPPTGRRDSSGSAPALPNPGLMSEAPSPPASGEIRKIRTAFEMQVQREHGLCLGVTSFGKAEGKTLTAYGLALAFAAAGSRTLLIDADARDPTLTQRLRPHLDQMSESGFAQALRGEDLSDLLSTSNIRHLSFMAVGRDCGIEGFSDRLNSAPAKELFRQLRERFDRVVVDLPDFSSLPDAWAIGSLVDFYVLVVATGRTGQPDIARTASALRCADARLAGVVLNEGAR